MLLKGVGNPWSSPANAAAARATGRIYASFGVDEIIPFQ